MFQSQNIHQVVPFFSNSLAKFKQSANRITSQKKMRVQVKSCAITTFRCNCHFRGRAASEHTVRVRSRRGLQPSATSPSTKLKVDARSSTEETPEHSVSHLRVGRTGSLKIRVAGSLPKNILIGIPFYWQKHFTVPHRSHEL